MDEILLSFEKTLNHLIWASLIASTRYIFRMGIRELIEFSWKFQQDAELAYTNTSSFVAAYFEKIANPII